MPPSMGYSAHIGVGTGYFDDAVYKFFVGEQGLNGFEYGQECFCAEIEAFHIGVPR